MKRRPKPLQPEEGEYDIESPRVSPTGHPTSEWDDVNGITPQTIGHKCSSPIVSRLRGPGCDSGGSSGARRRNLAGSPSPRKLMTDGVEKVLNYDSATKRSSMLVESPIAKEKLNLSSDKDCIGASLEQRFNEQSTSLEKNEKSESFGWCHVLLLVCGGSALMILYYFSVGVGTSKSADHVYIQDEALVLRTLSDGMTQYQPHKFPLSTSKKRDDYVSLSHPAAVVLYVPKFYLTPQGNSRTSMQNLSFHGRLLTRRVADMIGLYAPESGKLSNDANARTVFVSVISYRDELCSVTIESIFARAKHQGRIRVGVVDQLDAEADPSCVTPKVPCDTDPTQVFCKFRNQIDVIEMEANLAVGTPFARHIANRMYRGEYYALQIDSHVTFVQDWDTDIIQQMDSTRNEMAVISTYLSNAAGSIDEVSGKSIRPTRTLICNASYEGSGSDRRLHHDISEQPEAISPIQGSPQLQPYWSSGFSFSRGHFILSVPYDPFLSMIQRSDEEISMAIRAFTHGYDFYAPERNVCFDNSVGIKTGRRSFLENNDLYKRHERLSLTRLYGLLDMNTESITQDWNLVSVDQYGVGKVRHVSTFLKAFGVHNREKVTEKQLCDFVVSGKMHNLFHRHIRSDGMGIDYKHIHFHFHDLQQVA